MIALFNIAAASVLGALLLVAGPSAAAISANGDTLAAPAPVVAVR